MKVDFRSVHQVHLPDTMIFEDLYEPALKLDYDEKYRIITKGIATWLYLDNVLIGETYGACPAHLDEPIPDLPVDQTYSIYCYSTTILPPYQRRGFGKLLKAYWLGRCYSNYWKVFGHATNEAAIKLNTYFGAKFLPDKIHEHWCDSERTAYFYVIDL